jgi:bacterioferritin
LPDIEAAQRQRVRNKSDATKGREMISTPELIALLNGDLEREYAAAVQYTAHSAMLNGFWFAFVQELRDHASDEMRHAQLISDHINYLGGIVTAKMGPAYTASESTMMIKQDYDGEGEAIARYRERIAQCREIGDFGTEAILLEILKDEESHKNDLQSILNIKGGTYAY